MNFPSETRFFYQLFNRYFHWLEGKNVLLLREQKKFNNNTIQSLLIDFRCNMIHVINYNRLYFYNLTYS